MNEGDAGGRGCAACLVCETGILARVAEGRQRFGKRRHHGVTKRGSGRGWRSASTPGAGGRGAAGPLDVTAE